MAVALQDYVAAANHAVLLEQRAVQPEQREKGGLEAAVSYLPFNQAILNELGIQAVEVQGRVQYMASYTNRSYSDAAGEQVEVRGGNKFRSQQQVAEMIHNYIAYKQKMNQATVASLREAKEIALRYLPQRRFEQQVAEKLLAQQQGEYKTAISLKIQNAAFDSAYALAEKAGMLDYYVGEFSKKTAEKTGITYTPEVYQQKGHAAVVAATCSTLLSHFSVDRQLEGFAIVQKNQSVADKLSGARKRLVKSLSDFVANGAFSTAAAVARQTGLTVEYDHVRAEQAAKIAKLQQTLAEIKTSYTLEQFEVEQLDCVDTVLGLYKRSLQFGAVDLTTDKNKVIEVVLAPRTGRFSFALGAGVTHAVQQQMRPGLVFDLVGKYATTLEAEKRIDLLVYDKSRQAVQEAYNLAVQNKLTVQDSHDLYVHLQQHEQFERTVQRMFASRTALPVFSRFLDSYAHLKFDREALLKQFKKSQGNWFTSLFKRKPVYEEEQENFAEPAFAFPMAR